MVKQARLMSFFSLPNCTYVDEATSGLGLTWTLKSLEKHHLIFKTLKNLEVSNDSTVTPLAQWDLLLGIQTKVWR